MLVLIIVSAVGFYSRESRTFQMATTGTPEICRTRPGSVFRSPADVCAAVRMLPLYHTCVPADGAKDFAGAAVVLARFVTTEPCGPPDTADLELSGCPAGPGEVI